MANPQIMGPLTIERLDAVQAELEKGFPYEPIASVAFCLATDSADAPLDIYRGEYIRHVGNQRNGYFVQVEEQFRWRLPPTEQNKHKLPTFFVRILGSDWRKPIPEAYQGTSEDLDYRKRSYSLNDISSALIRVVKLASLEDL